MSRPSPWKGRNFNIAPVTELEQWVVDRVTFYWNKAHEAYGIAILAVLLVLTTMRRQSMHRH